MATIFEVMIAGEEETFAAGAARAAFEEIDRLEGDLSRHLPNSDVSRINNLLPDQSLQISPHTSECLRLSREYHRETAGAFDVTTGALKDCWEGRDRLPPAPSAEEIVRARELSGMSRLELDERNMTLRVHGPRVLIDLGAIGKGFAVDCAAGLLKEWGVGSALIHGGTSSAYAFGGPSGSGGWPVTISNPFRPPDLLERVLLDDQGAGGSGLRKGRHIIDPHKGVPVDGRRASWVLSPSAARSDALSTACMLMTMEEIAGLIARDQHLSAIIVEDFPPVVHRFGPAGSFSGASA